MATKKSTRPQAGSPKAGAKRAAQKVTASRTRVARPSDSDGDDGALLKAKPRVDFPIVGIGASAGGLEACSKLLAALPASVGLAVVIVPHLAPEHESALAELLDNATNLTVSEARDGEVVRSRHVYVLPANKQIELNGNRLQLNPRPNDRSQYMPIDHFFRSLAASARGRGIGIVLSGTASDGAAGLREVKAAGGITMAQLPSSAKYDGMPRAAIATGIVDIVLDPEDLARELALIAEHPFVAERVDQASDGAIEGRLHRIFALLRTSSGVDFTHYKLPTIKRRLERRMVLHKIDDVEQYIRFLHKNPLEVTSLYQDMLIHVTRFFREPESFKLLSKRVFPKVLSGRTSDTPIRIWVPGCSTGEEPYSVAISLIEHLRANNDNIPFQIFATDISEPAIEQARSGIYPESIGADVSPERLRRFFSRTERGYRINKEVRDLCIFARQDLTRDPPFSKLDLVVCRNVLIYLDRVLQTRLMEIFHYALRSTGFLMLGSAESVGGQSDLFTIADKRYKLYTRKSAPYRAEVTFYPERRGRDEPIRKEVTAAAGISALQNEANRIVLSRFSPPGVIVDSSLRIVQFRGQTGPFLEAAPGEASLNILKMARDGLLFPLRSALHESRKSKRRVRKDDVQLHNGSSTRDVTLEVIPLSPGENDGHFLVLFEESGKAAAPAEASPAVTSTGKRGAKGAGKSKGAGKDADKRGARTGSAATQNQRLLQDLAASREYSQSIIQDLEAANEELQSANEEILSSNEELQSTNEELDTAKEELQSTNEELNTVNEELQGRNDELSRVNSDLVNLLASVNIAIVMVSNDLRIRRYTPVAEKVLNLIQTDVGRPISDIKPNIEFPDLSKMITEAIDTVSTKERRVQDSAGKWFSLRVRPYKSLDNRIEGAVIAVVEGGAVETEMQLEAARDFAEAVFDTVHQPLLVLTGEFIVKNANRAFYRLFQTTPAQTEDVSIFELGNGGWNLASLRTSLQDVLTRNRSLEGLRVPHLFPEISRQSLTVQARRISGADGSGSHLILEIKPSEMTP